MNLRDICAEALATTERLFGLIEVGIPPAQWVPWSNRYNWRFVEQLPSQALMQKLARQLSGLRATDCLLLNGYLQEVGTMFRVLDEVSEDIMFITLGLSTGSWTKHHDSYLQYFWSEDEDGPPPVQRKTVRAYVHRAFDQPNPAAADKVGRTVYQAFSDFVHARSSTIMGMVSGPPARFVLGGTKSSEARFQFVEQMPTYFYRGLVSTGMVARVCAAPEIASASYSSIKEFERKYGHELFPQKG